MKLLPIKKIIIPIFIGLLVPCSFMEKYQRDDIVGIKSENERDENYRSKSNPQIDSKHTPFNYHFIKPNDSYTAFMSQRMRHKNH